MSSQKVENWRHKKYVGVNKSRHNEVIAEYKAWGKCFVEQWLQEKRVEEIWKCMLMYRMKRDILGYSFVRFIYLYIWFRPLKPAVVSQTWLNDADGPNIFGDDRQDFAHDDVTAGVIDPIHLNWDWDSTICLQKRILHLLSWWLECYLEE